MHVRFAIPAAVIVAAVAVAACSGGQPSTYIAPPAAAPTAAAGALALSSSGQTQSAGTASGFTAILTYGGGSGTVTASSSATNPAATTAVTPTDRIRVAATSSPTSPNVYYLTISSTAGATLNALPAVNLTLSPAAVGSVQEAEYKNGKWQNIASAAGTPNTSSPAGATSVSFPPLSGAITIPAGGSIYLAFYQGTYPGPTPPGQIVNTAIADPSFEGTAAPLGSTINTKGWTVCTITSVAAGATLPSNRPLSSFTPTPGTTPQAQILPLGTSVPQGTGTPKPTQSTVPVNTGNQAAVFGGVFSNYNDANWAYNGLCEQVTIPQNPVAELSVFANGTENSLTYLGFDVDVLDTTGAFEANLVDENQIAVSPPGDAAYRTLTINSAALAPFAGQTVDLFVGIWTKAGSSSNSTVFSGYYFVDDFNMAGQ